jgi:hypothetical protein
VTGEDDRRAELERGLAAVRSRIAAACTEHRRDPTEITLVVVTKTFPASDIAILASLGVRDIAENRHQEAAAKVAVCADLAVRWHFVGQLQTNKAAAVAHYADIVQSVDRRKLVAALARGASAANRRLGALVQVDLDERAGALGRGGAPPDQVLGVAEAIAAAPGLDLLGVMAVAPLDQPAAPAFERLRRASEQVQARFDGASWVSAGMSADFETALAFGATHVRIGSALLGQRPVLR